MREHNDYMCKFRSYLRNYWSFFSLACFLYLGFPLAALPQTLENEKTGVYTLGEIVVSAQKEGVETAGTVREVTAEDIQNKDARNLAEALELLPGVEVRTGSEGTPRVDLRGFRSRHVLLLLDGIPLNSTFDGQFDPSIIPTENIAKIKVSYGTSSVLYGQGGLAGVINIITKKGKEGFQGMASGEVGEGLERIGRFNLSGAKKNANFFLSGSMAARRGFRLSDDFDPTPLEDGDLRSNSDARRNNLFGNIGYSITEGWDIGLVASYTKGNYGVPPSTKESTKTDPDPFANNPKYERVNDLEGFSAQLSTSYDLPGPADIRGWLYFNNLDEERTRYDNSNYNSLNEKGSYFEDNKSKVWGGALQGSYDLKSYGFFTIGLDAQRQDYRTTGKVRDVKVGKEYEFRYFDDKWNLDVYDASIEYEVSLFQNFGVVLGYSHHWLNKQEGSNDNDGSYLAGVHYDVLKDTRLKGSFARKIRFPTIRQLYEREYGNPDLKTEKSYNYELGIEQGLPLNSRVALTGFLSDVKNYIEKPFKDSPYENNDKYRFRGFELTAETRFMRHLMLRANYTFLDTKDKSPGTEKDELQYRPKNKLTFEGKYSFPFGFSAYMNVIYVADQVYYSRTTPLEKKELNNYALVNVKFDQTLLNGLLDIYVGADNLFDKDYEESYGFPMAGRTVYGGVEVHF
ncbi:MAG: TonB-dependent receptor [Deltaproteobacteria bacterium]|nr:TonB-dependent receptor [Deltaproteobacteria bacterium]